MNVSQSANCCPEEGFRVQGSMLHALAPKLKAPSLAFRVQRLACSV
jgi:hypothetical protein